MPLNIWICVGLEITDTCDPGSLYSLTSVHCQFPAMIKEVVDKTNPVLREKNVTWMTTSVFFKKKKKLKILQVRITYVIKVTQQVTCTIY